MNNTNQKALLGIAACGTLAILSILLWLIYRSFRPPISNDPIGETESGQNNSIGETEDGQTEEADSVPPPPPESDITEEIIANCTSLTALDEGQCKKAIEDIRLRFSGLNLEQIEWATITPVYNCSESTLFEATFSDGGNEMEVEFFPNGELAEIEYGNVAISDDRLPEVVRQAVKNDYPDFSRTTFEMEQMQSGVRLFEFEISAGAQDIDVTYDQDANRVTPNACED